MAYINLPLPVTYGLWMLLGMMISLTLVSHLVPDSWISIKTAQCQKVLSDFDSKKWLSGGYTAEEVKMIRNCA